MFVCVLSNAFFFFFSCLHVCARLIHACVEKKRETEEGSINVCVCVCVGGFRGGPVCGSG